MDKEMFEKVRDFVAEHLSVKKNKLSEQTSLDKLGVTGDDALEFMEEFMKRFSVDMSDFEFKKHFDAEGSFMPLLPEVLIFSFLFARNNSQKIPITLRDLTEAAQNKKWIKRVAKT